MYITKVKFIFDYFKNERDSRCILTRYKIRIHEKTISFNYIK